MRILGLLAAGALAILLLFAVAIRVPAVQNRLFDRALAQAFDDRGERLFDGDGLKAVLCGTSSPLATTKRAQACTAIIAGDQFFLVDAGTASWETLQAGGVPADRLAGVFLTHFHSDHIGDLSEANLASWVMGRDAPLSVYGPEGVEDVVRGVNAAFALDGRYRTAHHGKGGASPRTAKMTPAPFALEKTAVVFDDAELKVTAFLVDHEPATPSVGYRFEYQGRSLFVSGDTAYSESVIEASRGVDLLIHEAQADHMVAELEKAAAQTGRANLAKIFSDIPSYHTTPEEAAEVANSAEADWLVLTHLTPPPDNIVAKRIFMRGVSKVRPKHIRLGEDGMVILLPERGGVAFSRL